MNLYTDCPDLLLPGLPVTSTPCSDPEDITSSLSCFFSSGRPGCGQVAISGCHAIERLVAVQWAERSQFDLLLEQESEIPRGTAAMALEGQNFHGQRGRPWQAVSGNIHLSVLVQPSKSLSDYGVALTAVPAVAAFRTVKMLDPAAEAGIKWVNDVLVAGQKISGVIASTRTLGDTLKAVVFGVGFNVETSPDVVPTPFVPKAGCLNQTCGLSHHWSEVLPVLLRMLDQTWMDLETEGPDGLLELYRAASLVPGRKVRIARETDDGEITRILAEGRVQEILPDLSLRLEGVPDPVTRGRLALIG